MNFTLNNHIKGYSFSWRDGLLSAVTGFSGIPYAQRHWDLFLKKNTWSQLALTTLLASPVIGGAVALWERTIAPSYPRHRGPGLLSKSQALPKMVENSMKAIKEHRTKSQDTTYACLGILPSVKEMLQSKPPLSFTCAAAEAQGNRRSMEDAHFFKEFAQGTLVGVFDGHGNNLVSRYASKRFQEAFPELLDRTGGNVHAAFEMLIHQIHEEVIQHLCGQRGGTTAVISFIDRDTHQIYTATLGDSEANIYRSIEGEGLKSIPLSCVRDWGSEKEALRAAIALGKPEIAEAWPKVPHPKYCRYPDPVWGLNISRAIGDLYYTGLEDMRGVIHKPKITVNLLKGGDRLVLACDGLKDYVSEAEIAEQLENSWHSGNPAQRLVNFAINRKGSRDNVTVVVVDVSNVYSD